MNDYLRTLWWTNFNMDLYLKILQAKAKKEHLTN